MYKVLHIMPAADIGGISTIVLNYYRHIDRDKIRFDVALTSDRDGQDASYFRELGATFYRIPPKSLNYAKFERELSDILVKGAYDCVHVHENTTSYVALRIAKKLGIKNRIAHAHTSAPIRSITFAVKRLSGCVLNACYATALIGCGELAGERVFGRLNMLRKNAMILPNAIDTEAFAFSEEKRNNIRVELGLQNKHVIGMVGRLSPEKNHMYALHLMRKLHDRMPEVVLVVVGNGEEEEAIQEIINRNQMQEYVQLLGRRSDVASLYQAFDVLIMPSLHEGFPMAAVEGMASGLPVLMSDNITSELDFASARYIKLGDDETWLSAMLNSNTNRAVAWQLVKTRGLDIRDTGKQLQVLYLGGKSEEASQ